MSSPLPSAVSRRNDGFVLVSVLLIVALATVLVVASSIMAQIERRAAANSAKVDLARNNALFALDVALNQLQTAAGPDQRVTARAEILDASPNTPAVTGVTQPYWTGVWNTEPEGSDKSKPAGLDITNSGTPQRQVSLGAISPSKIQISEKASWLVSGAENLDPIDFSGVTTGAGRNAVVLASEYGPDTDEVIAPLVPVQLAQTGTSQETGAYAYWVSDEGLKAKINATTPTLGVSPSADASKNLAHFIGPQAAAAHKGLDVFAGTDIRPDADLPKVVTLPGLANLSGLSDLQGKKAARYASDITLHSRSVLADVRRGGLRKDLTAAFEDTNTGNFTSFLNSFGNGASMVYRSASSADMTVPAINTGATPPTDGLLWHGLYFFYNAYKGVQPSPIAISGNAITPTSSGSPATLPQRQSFRSNGVLVGGATAKVGSIMPVAIAYRVDVALSSYQQEGVWKLRLHYYPQLVLWNPFSVRLQLPDNYQFQRNVGAFSTAGSYNPGNPTVTSIRIVSTTGGTTTTGPYFRVNQTIEDAGRLRLGTVVGDASVMEPGETRVFALERDAVRSNPQEAIRFTNLVSNEAMSPDFSQQCDVLSGANELGVSTGTPFTTTDPTTRINVQIAARSLRCQNVDTFIFPRELKWPTNDGAVRVFGGGGWDIQAAQSAWDGNLQIQQLNGSPRRIIGFYVRHKGILPSASANSYSNASSNVPMFMGNSPTLSLTEDLLSFPWQEVYLRPLGTLYQNGQTDVQMAPSGKNWETSIGTESAGVAPPGNRVVLRDVPNQPMISLGQFMHMPAMNFRSIGTFEMMGFGSMFVGGSASSPIVPTTQNAIAASGGTVTGGGANNRLFLDDSFLANEALFDRFFFSTVPPQTLNAGNTTYPSAWTDFNAANSGNRLSNSDLPLLNTRMKPYFKDGIAPRMDDLRNLNKAAANLMLDGGFNVNSTSVAAWKAFLGGLSGNDLRLWNATAKGIQSVSTADGVPFARFWSGSGQTAPNQLWSGLRVISDSELEDLAEQIVEQVKLRGPFLSISDFLNRRLGAPSTLTTVGALQAAIDRSGINNAIKGNGLAVNGSVPAEANKVPPLIPANMRDGAGNAWNTTMGVPGYLMQQDLVQALAPSLVARSDTFVIRTFGEVRNPRNGDVEGRAWAEAIVQRLPDFVDKNDSVVSSTTGLGDATAIADVNEINKKLGRRFKVVSFRWLNENEI